MKYLIKAGIHLRTTEGTLRFAENIGKALCKHHDVKCCTIYRLEKVKHIQVHYSKRDNKINYIESEA